MDHLITFVLTNEEADLVVGARRGRGGRGRRFLKSLSEEDRTAVKNEITALRESDGWADMTREERRAGIKAIIEPYREA